MDAGFFIDAFDTYLQQSISGTRACSFNTKAVTGVALLTPFVLIEHTLVNLMLKLYPLLRGSR